MGPIPTGEDRRGLALAGAGVQVRTDGEGGESRFRGHAAVFDERTAIGNPLTWGFYEEIAPGAFTKTLSEGDARKLIDHDPYYVVSRVSAGTLDLAQDKRGLAVDSALDTELSYVNDLIANLRNGNITGMSFGFYVVKDDWSVEDIETNDGNAAHVEVRRILEIKLVEVSSVTFPAYDATDAGVRAEDEVRAVGLALGRRPDGNALLEARCRYRPELDAYRLREQLTVTARDDRGAVKSHGTATSTKAWDGPANKARLSTDAGAATFRRAFAWQDPDKDADTKAAWKFIHHEVDSDGNVGAANTNACTTGIAVLNGGRGGTTIPDSDRQGVYNHLAKHLRDAGVEPAELKSDPEPGETTPGPDVIDVTEQQPVTDDQPLEDDEPASTRDQEPAASTPALRDQLRRRITAARRPASTPDPA